VIVFGSVAIAAATIAVPALFGARWWVLVAAAGILGATSNALLFRRLLARLRARNP
jgi:hypothetical protein